MLRNGEKNPYSLNPCFIVISIYVLIYRFNLLHVNIYINTL